jgi:hypothetical protein
MPGTVSAASKNQALDDCGVDGAPGNLAFSLERKKSFVSVLYVWRSCLSFFDKVFPDRVDVLLYLDKQ